MVKSERDCREMNRRSADCRAHLISVKRFATAQGSDCYLALRYERFAVADAVKAASIARCYGNGEV